MVFKKKKKENKKTKKKRAIRTTDASSSNTQRHLLLVIRHLRRSSVLPATLHIHNVVSVTGRNKNADDSSEVSLMLTSDSIGCKCCLYIIDIF